MKTYVLPARKFWYFLFGFFNDEQTVCSLRCLSKWKFFCSLSELLSPNTVRRTVEQRMDNIIRWIFSKSRFDHNCLLSMTVMMTCVLIWIPQTIHFRYFTFVNYEHHKRKRNDVIGRIIITTTMAAVIVTAFYVLTHLQVRICLFPDSQGHSSIRCRPVSEFSFWQDKKIFWHSGRIPNSSFALRRNHSFSIIERVHPGFGNGEKQFVARGSPNDLKNAARLFFDAEGELLHSPNGPIVRERDDTSKRAFLFYKTKSEMNILNHSHTVNRPITAPEVSATAVSAWKSQDDPFCPPTPGESVVTCLNILLRSIETW